ncbi:tail-specific protease, partial [Pseudomonas sp. CrR25]|nr:tail-specific protease [Pseudomonas sp. CrR25]
MRYQLLPRRISMKRSLLSATLALAFGLSALPLAAKTTSADPWEYLQPDREQVIASLNVVELLKRHHYNKPPLN